MPPTTNQVNLNAGQAGLAQNLANALNQVNKTTLYTAASTQQLTGAQKVQGALMAIQQQKAADLAAAQTKLALAYGLASGALLGYIRAGLSGTTTGEHLSFQFTELNRQIAALFLPAIEKAIQKLTQLTQWFRNLSGATQQSIGRWLGVGTAMLGVLTIGPKLIGLFKLIGGTFTAAFAASPLLAIIGGIGLLMAQSEGGRESLFKLGDAAMSAFGSLAEILAGVVLPLVQMLAEALSRPGGQLLALGLVATLAAGRVVAACRAMAAGFMTVGGAITLGLGLIGLLALALSGSGSAVGKAMDDIAAGVRSGKKSIEDAKKEVEELAREEAFKEAEKARGGPGAFGGAAEGINPLGLLSRFNREQFDEEQRRKQIEAEGKGKVDRAAAGKANRSDLVTSRTGTEGDPKATLRRIEDSILKSGIEAKQLDKLEEIRKLLDRMGFGGAKQGGEKDTRNLWDKIKENMTDD